MPVLSARGISKAYGARSLFADLSLTIVRGERVGLLGDNGAGKTTLLRVLAGLEPTDGGVIERRKGARVMVLDQRPDLDEALTPRQIVREGLGAWSVAKDAYDAVGAALQDAPEDAALIARQAELGEELERLGGWEVEHQIEEVCERLGVIDLDRAVGTMSGGEQRRTAMARLLVAQPDLAILDEPTNHLDTDTITWLEEHLATEFKGSVLFVTHDRYFLDAVCTRILELERGGVNEFSGGYTDYVTQKAEMLAHEARVEQNRQNIVRRETAWLRRGAKARSTKQKARIGRAEDLIAAKPVAREERVSFNEVGQRSARMGKTIVDFENVRIELGGKTLVDELDLCLVKGDRIGIIGKNGIGKTSLLRAVLGELEPASGKIAMGQNTRIAVVDQARASVEESWSVFDNVAGFEGADRTSGGQVPLGDKTVSMKAYIEHFGFDGHSQRRALSSLSGGERARVVIAKVLKDGANLLLLDEPTNDLDTGTLAALEELLEAWPGCALVVSHDRAFLDNIATAILAFEGDGKVVLYPGNYDTYCRLKAQAKAQAQQEGRAARSSAPPPPIVSPRAASLPSPPVVAKSSASTKPLSYAERTELGTLLERIADAEAKVAAIDATLADPATYAGRGAEVAKLRKEHAAAAADVARLYARWEELEARSARR